MALINQVHDICARIAADAGWQSLFGRQGLSIGISPANLAAELQRPLTVDRTISGFEDFAEDGVRAIEPGSPSRSLLYHGLASPNVLKAPNGLPLTLFPTPAELDVLENYIFAVSRLSLDDISARFVGNSLTVVVFACEYRPASQTTHRRHADMVFARTGIARVGTHPARYVPEFRGFHPEVPSQPFDFAVSPARYAAYLAVQMEGSRADVQLMRPMDGDGARRFWIPVQKLFSGTECLTGLDLQVTFDASHVNEKIFRAQRLLGNHPPDEPPYRITAGLCGLSTDKDHGPGWIVPMFQPHLVAEAKTLAGADVTFAVPANKGRWAAIDLWGLSGLRSGPEYLHARTQVLPDGTRRNLNTFNQGPGDQPVDDRVRTGGYTALQYVDFTADGLVSATCPQVQGIGGVADRSEPAYSLIAAPDFYPSCDQRELCEWNQSSAVPDVLQSQIWGQGYEPTPLSDQRLPANLQLPPASPFSKTDTTMTAIVGLPIAPSFSPNPATKLALRHSHLPDDGAGVFSPGWDVSRDELDGIKHLAAYGLGSPFPEDSKLCAALSSFWPAVAPDVTRTMDTAQKANLSGTVIPMTDTEIGRIGVLPWDGVPGPTEIQVGGAAVAEYNSFVNADYVLNALAKKFSLMLTSRLDSEIYTDRILAMAFGYLALGVERTNSALNPALHDLPTERDQWIVLSFKDLESGDPEVTQAVFDTAASVRGSSFRATVFRATDDKGTAIPFTTPADFRKRRIEITGRVELILAPAVQTVLLKNASDPKWRLGVVKLA